MYLSNDGKYLVRLGPWAQLAVKNNLGVSFYKNGVLVKKYLIKDLVKDEKSLVQNALHYNWLARDALMFKDKKIVKVIVSESKLRLDNENQFHLKTIDGIKYVFDVESGNIVMSLGQKSNQSEKPSKIDTPKKKSEE